MDNTEATQEEVNTAKSALEKAISGLSEKEEVVDKSELENLYNENKDKEQGNYTDESWAAFVKALENAKEVLDNTEATQEEVNTAKSELENTILALDEINNDNSSETDKEDLPKTGEDNNSVWLTIFTMLLSLVAILFKKKENVRR